MMNESQTATAYEGCRPPIQNSASLNDSKTLVAAKTRLAKYLASVKRNKSTMFHFSAWHWHNLSIVRESARLREAIRGMRAAQVVSGEDCDSLRKAANHVVRFNMAALSSYERKLWIPWLRNKFSVTENGNDLPLEDIHAILDSLQSKRNDMQQQGEYLVRMQHECLCRNG